jgi:hypothetical protein
MAHRHDVARHAVVGMAQVAVDVGFEPSRCLVVAHRNVLRFIPWHVRSLYFEVVQAG